MKESNVGSKEKNVWWAWCLLFAIPEASGSGRACCLLQKLKGLMASPCKFNRSLRGALDSSLPKSAAKPAAQSAAKFGG